VSKIGDIFSGGTKIGEVWTDDGNGCAGCGCLLGIVFIAAIIMLLIQGLWWLWQNEPLAIFALPILPVGSIVTGVMGDLLIIHGNMIKRKQIAKFVFLIALSATICGTVFMVLAVIGMSHDNIEDRDHFYGGALILLAYTLLWVGIACSPILGAFIRK